MIAIKHAIRIDEISAMQLLLVLINGLHVSLFLFFLYLVYIYKHRKFPIQLCLTFQGTRLPVWEKFNFNVAAKCEYIFSDFDLFINLVKGRLVSLANTYNSIGLIKFKEKI